MTIDPSGIKRGQQLIMPMARLEESPEILNGLTLIAIDIRSDWDNILKTICEEKKIQKSMELSYQDFQEGFKLKDFKHRNGVKGVWSFQDINEGIYPYTLTTTDWVIEYEEKEWEAQACDDESEAKTAIDNAIGKCSNVERNLEILKGLESAKGKLIMKYLPRPSQPESWRPQNASHWTAQWMKILAEEHYHNLSNDWRLVASNTHCIVAGFTNNNTVYLLDLTLLTNNSEEIFNKLLQN